MKLLSIILQNSKGEPILIVCSNCFPLTSSINYSYLIYDFIIQSYKNNLRVERSFPLTNDLYCVNNVTKQFILSILISKNDLMLGYDGLRKLSDYFNRNIRTDNIMKKIVELFGAFEEFLYCRELPLGELILPIRPDKSSKKRSVQLQVLNRFSHVYLEPQKRGIVEIQMRQAKIEEIQTGIKNQVVRNSRNFCIKVFEEENISTDITKEKFIINYKNRLFGNTFVTRKPELINLPAYEQQQQVLKTAITIEKKQIYPLKKSGSISSTIPLVTVPKRSDSISNSVNMVPQQSEILFTPEKQEEQHEVDVKPQLNLPQNEISFMDVFHVPTSPRPTQVPHFNNSLIVKVRMNEKLQLVLVDEKVKNINQYGQVSIQVSSLEKVNLSLISAHWMNKAFVISRITPNSFKTKQLQSDMFEVEIDQSSKSKGVIDYIITKQTFNYNKIPLMFVSSFQTRKNNKQNIIEFTFKYKVNDKWKGNLYDIDIQVVLDPYIIFSDCKTNPLANSLKGKVVTWKAKQLKQNAKGKLSLALYDTTIEPKEIIKQIKLNMRTEKSLLPEMDVQFYTGGSSSRSRAKKNLTIQYKILPK